MVAPPSCPLCGRLATKIDIPVGAQVDCEQCGRFELTGTAEAALANADPRLKLKIGFWTRDQTELGDLPRITHNTITQLETLPELTVAERAERLLRFAIREQKDLGGIDKISVCQSGWNNSLSI